jgi:hypothetical protein
VLLDGGERRVRVVVWSVTYKWNVCSCCRGCNAATRAYIWGQQCLHKEKRRRGNVEANERFYSRTTKTVSYTYDVHSYSNDIRYNLNIGFWMFVGFQIRNVRPTKSGVQLSLTWSTLGEVGITRNEENNDDNNQNDNDN